MLDSLPGQDLEWISDRLNSSGLPIRLGPFVASVTSPIKAVARAISILYDGYPLAPPGTFVDFHVRVRRQIHWRKPLQPLVTFEFDGDTPFNPLPGDQGFPLLEWGLNWSIYANCHQYLILHAAVLARDDAAIVMPAPSGTGKSTLCAGLLFSGWRLLSDELALIDPSDARLTPLPRPVSLKNQSIDVIQRFAPEVRFGSIVEETTKGVVAHFAAPAEAVALAGSPARARWVVLPEYVPGAQARLVPIDRAQAFMAMVENAFNYDVFGREGFELLARLLDGARAYRFVYSGLDDAASTFDRLARDLPR